MKTTKWLVRAAGLLLFGVVAITIARAALPCLAPFIIALALAAATEPAVRFCEEHFRAPRQVFSLVASLLLLAAIGGAVALVSVRAAALVSSVTEALPEYLARAAAFLSGAENSAQRYISSAPEVVREYLRSALSYAEEQLGRIPELISARVPALITATVQKTPAALLFAVTAGLGTYFISASYPQIKAFFRRQLPEKSLARWDSVRGELGGILGQWLRAQAILMGATFVGLLLCLVILRVKNALVLSLLIALVDALPVLGVGTVLLPWAAVCLLVGNFRLAAGLAVSYGALTLLRSCLQAKVVGSQLGLHPLVSLLAIYVGYRTCGVAGMLLFPLAAVVLCRLNAGGVISLWK
jgi:sporulation integral membrane protein YtvI